MASAGGRLRRRRRLRGCPDAPARPAGLAFFSTPRAAAVASQVALGRDLEFRVAKAPPAGDIAWGNLARVPALHQPLVSSAWRLLLCAVVAFYMVPIAAVSAVSTLANLSSLLPFLKPAIAIPVVNGILSGILPTLALLIFLALLPTLVGGIAWASGLATQSQADVYVLSGLFLFYVVNVFLGAVLAQSVLSALKAITADPPSVVKLLATTIPGTSRFFIAFVALKAGSLVAGTTVLVNNVVYRALRLLAGARNTRADEAAWLPQPILLAVNVADSCAAGAAAEAARAVHKVGHFLF